MAFHLEVSIYPFCCSCLLNWYICPSIFPGSKIVDFCNLSGHTLNQIDTLKRRKLTFYLLHSLLRKGYIFLPILQFIKNFSVTVISNENPILSSCLPITVDIHITVTHSVPDMEPNESFLACIMSLQLHIRIELINWTESRL